ncbi:hypothetical protein BpHYR1_035612 [Brachionus plicatilis]|uniref:Uncharacterized protein n=1 Tax=Brachionus plicatilis TaxID=10195 RepID=A0A3M7Q6X1_BRAPC|nr:hypothetical protein BpHYR1_035612 [Brachionus plicatilis]
MQYNIKLHKKYDFISLFCVKLHTKNAISGDTKNGFRTYLLAQCLGVQEKLLRVTRPIPLVNDIGLILYFTMLVSIIFENYLPKDKVDSKERNGEQFLDNFTKPENKNCSSNR